MWHLTCEVVYDGILNIYLNVGSRNDVITFVSHKQFGLPDISKWTLQDSVICPSLGLLAMILALMKFPAFQGTPKFITMFIQPQH